MNDDLGLGLQALHRHMSDGDPNLEDVIKGGKRRRLHRNLAASGLILTLVLGAVVGFRVIDREGGPSPAERTGAADPYDGIVVPAEEGEPTYKLRDFQIVYPWAPIDSMKIRDEERYCSVRDEWECAHRLEQAGFSYLSSWATNDYPGTVECLVKLTSADGSVVGQATWTLTALKTRYERHNPPRSVRVSGRPEKAFAHCEAGFYPPGPGVRVEFIRAETYTPDYIGQDLPDRIRLIFEAHPLVESDHIDSRMCFQTLWFESGRKEAGEFTTNSGDGPWEFETGYPASDPIIDATITCREIRASDG